MLDFIATPFQMEDLHKLKEAGANSVVISTPFFSVRGAGYFEREALPCVKKQCESLGLAMLVMVNRFFTEEELPKLIEFLKELKTLQVDGIYYGDECVLYEAKKLNMVDKLIYNPDTLITNHADVQFYLDEGISMVSISKEITKDEICEIAHQVQGNIEIIIHGRVNMMHSKRNLISNYLEFIHQPQDIKGKRSLYIMEETREDHMPIMEDEFGTHVFSGYTLASFMEIKDFVDAGICHMRIDGIFHDIDYVCEALRLYHDILNGSDAKEIDEMYHEKYKEDHVTSGFYYTKTSKVKVGE